MLSKHMSGIKKQIFNNIIKAHILNWKQNKTNKHFSLSD